MEFNSAEIIKIAQGIEEKGSLFYKMASELPFCKEYKEVLLKFSEMENKHYQRFVSLEKNIEEIKYYNNDEMKNYLAERFSTDFFNKSNLEKLNFKEVKDVFKEAIKAEEISIEFYTLLKKFTKKEETIKLLDEIIKEEKDHKEYFTGILNKIK